MRLALGLDLVASRGCQECPYDHHCDEDGARPGSNGRSPVPLVTLLGPGRGERHEVFTCPLALTSGGWWPPLRAMFLAYDNGLMLNAGGLGEQPAWYVEAMAVLSRERREHEEYVRKNADEIEP